MKRILHLVPSLKRGGAETQLAYLGSGLARSGWNVHVACFDEGENADRLRRAGVSLHRIPSASSSSEEWESGGVRDPRSLWRIGRLIGDVAPSLVQTWIPAMDILGGLAATVRGVPWVLSERSDPSRFPNLPKIRARALLARRATAVVSNSVGGDAYWSNRVGPRTLRRVIVNAIPSGEIRSSPPADLESIGASATAPLVLYMGRVQPGKNVEALVTAFARVVSESPAVCVLCGMGPLAGRVDEMIADGRLAGRVFRLGFVAEVWRWLRRADAFVSVSNFEGMPNSVMEAMAAGVPLVLSDIPAHRAIVDDDMARFVAKDDPREIARALLDTLADREEAEARARRATKRAESWSVDALVDRYASLYEEVLDLSQRRRIRRSHR